MPSCVRSLALMALGLGMATVSKAAVGDSGTGSTTRYWDCCKGSCSWPDKASVSSPVGTCAKDDSPLTDANTASACDGGSAYMCSDQSPWAESADLAYGFAAVSIPGGSESSWCCACYELTFTSTSIAGKKMIVQATNTGADLASGQFDLAIPGGGVGIYNACTDEWGAPANGWGAQYGGISSNTCSSFPSALQPGCSFRFGDFFEGADNPTVDWKQVTCPKALTDKTGCVRDGETPTGSGSSDSSSTADAVSSATKATSATSAASSATSVAAVSSSNPGGPVSSVVASSNPGGPMSSAVASSPPSYGSSSVGGGVSYSSASASASSSALYSFSNPGGPISSLPSGGMPSGGFPSGGLPPYGSGVGPTGTGSYPMPTGGSGGEQCQVEYVYVDESM